MSSSFLRRARTSFRFSNHPPNTCRFVHSRRESTFSGAEAFEPSFAAAQRPSFWRPILFVVGVSSGSFAAAAYFTNQDTLVWSKKLGQGAWWRHNGPTSQEMQKARKFALHKSLTERLKQVVEETKGMPGILRMYYQRLWVTLAELRLNSSDGRRASAMLIGLNAIVFVAWQVPVLRSRMIAHWLHSPLSGKSYTMATSTFSQQNLLHFGFNMFALVSFGSAAFDWLGKEQMVHKDRLPESTYLYHSFAFFLTGGIVSSLVSHLISTRVRLPRLLAALSSTAAKTGTTPAAASILPSLGSSGAIYSAVTLSALALPYATVSIVFLPWIQIPISAGVSGIVLLDIVGALRGWRMFDHWAHLGGAAFGVMYFYYGPQTWDWCRRQVGSQRRPKKES